MEEEDLKDIVKELEVTGVMAEADKNHRKMLEADSEWTREEYVSISDLIAFFAHGVINADSWYRGYRLPPGYESVVNYVADRFERHFREKDVLGFIVKLSPLAYEDLLVEWCHEHPQFREWNTYPGSGISHRYSAIPESREFIDLGAITRNAAVLLRNKFRADARFDLEFYLNHKDEHPEWFDEKGNLRSPDDGGPSDREYDPEAFADPEE